MLLLFASLFFTEPTPLDMPKAEAYLVRENGEMRLEDRYDRLDLWTSQAVVGRWTDADGRVFTLSRLDFEPPAVGMHETQTRSDYVSGRKKIDKRKIQKVRRAIAVLSPVELPEKGEAPRQMSRGFEDIDYWHGTNLNAVVCAFLPAKSETWFLATWELVEGDDHDSMVKLFTDDFLEGDWKERYGKIPERGKPCGERELLRADARHSVAAYENWRCTDAEEFSVLDELPLGRNFIIALTNDLSVMRRRYAEVMPSPLNGSNVLCVARIFADRESYCAAVGEEMEWSAAYWNPMRRELVAYLPASGDGELLKTVRHEAFHQYLSYATSMISASPWLNEGYAQYFECDDGGVWGEGIALTGEWLENAARMLPSLMKMDYAQFYSGSNQERRLKYRLAWSIAYFIEKGAEKVRFNPFRNLKRDYIAALLKYRDMHRATEAAFANTEMFEDFIDEWKRFWTAHPL
jgi:hypothetical protein